MAVIELSEGSVQLGALPPGSELVYWKAPLGDEQLKPALEYFDTRCYAPEVPARRGINHSGVHTFVMHQEENNGLYFKTRSIEVPPEQDILKGHVIIVSSIIELQKNGSDVNLPLGYYAEDHLYPRADEPINLELVKPHDRIKHGKAWITLGYIATHTT